MSEEFETAYRGLLFDTRRSVRYHMRRRSFYERLHASATFMALIFGSATLAAFGAEVAKEWPTWVKLLPAALTSMLSGLDLLVGSTSKAWLHADLARKFIDLERELEKARGRIAEAVLAEMTDRRLVIEASEPRILRVLDTVCYNEMLRAMGYPPERQIPLTFWQRCFANLFDFQEHKLA